MTEIIENSKEVIKVLEVPEVLEARVPEVPKVTESTKVPVNVEVTVKADSVKEAEPMALTVEQRKMILGEKIKARLVGGTRRSAVRGIKKPKTVLSILTELLNDKEYQMSKELPDLGAVEFLSNSENHKKVENPTVRISSKLRLILIIGKMIDLTTEEKEKLVMPVFPAEQEDVKDVEGRHQRRFKPVLAKSLKDHQMNELSDIGICRLIIQNASHIVKDAKVFQIDDGKVFIVWGDLVMSGTSRKPTTSTGAGSEEDDGIPTLTEIDDKILSDSVNIDTKPGAAGTAGTVAAAAEDEGELQIPDGATFSPNDVQLVVENSGCTQSEAIQELIYNKGDLINTIMAFTPDGSGLSPAMIRADTRRKAKEATREVETEKGR